MVFRVLQTTWVDVMAESKNSLIQCSVVLIVKHEMYEKYWIG